MAHRCRTVLATEFVLAGAERHRGQPLNWVVRRHSMLFDIYGRFRLEILREADGLVAYRIEPGKRIKVPELGFPTSLSDGEVAAFLDDLYHEMARPNQVVRRIDAEPGKGNDV